MKVEDKILEFKGYREGGQWGQEGTEEQQQSMLFMNAIMEPNSMETFFNVKMAVFLSM